MIHPAAAQRAAKKAKRVAGPGKKLGRPRKNPLPTIPEPAVDNSDLSIVDLVAPILEAAPASVAAPIFDVAPEPKPTAPAAWAVVQSTAAQAAPAVASPPPPPAVPAAATSPIPARPPIAASDFHVPPPAMPVRLDAALATFDSDDSETSAVSAEVSQARAEEALVWADEPEAIEARRWKLRRCRRKCFRPRKFRRLLWWKKRKLPRSRW